MWAKVSLNCFYLNCAVLQLSQFPLYFLMKGIRQSSTVSVSYIKTRYAQWNVLGSSFSNEGPRLSARGIITKLLWKFSGNSKRDQAKKGNSIVLDCNSSVFQLRTSTKIFKFGQKTMWYEKNPETIHEYKSVCNNILTLLELISFEEEHFKPNTYECQKIGRGGRTPLSNLNGQSMVESPNEINWLAKINGRGSPPWPPTFLFATSLWCNKLLSMFFFFSFSFDNDFTKSLYIRSLCVLS